MLSNLEKVIDLERTGRQHQPDYMEEPGDLKVLKFRGPLPPLPSQVFDLKIVSSPIPSKKTSSLERNGPANTQAKSRSG